MFKSFMQLTTNEFVIRLGNGALVLSKDALRYCSNKQVTQLTWGRCKHRQCGALAITQGTDLFLTLFLPFKGYLRLSFLDDSAYMDNFTRPLFGTGVLYNRMSDKVWDMVHIKRDQAIDWNLGHRA